jgi:hypothetical protein
MTVRGTEVACQLGPRRSSPLREPPNVATGASASTTLTSGHSPRPSRELSSPTLFWSAFNRVKTLGVLLFCRTRCGHEP